VSDARRLVDKLWSYCNVLRDDGVSTIEYTEQLTYLLFLKMAHERETRALKPERIVPPHCSWQRLLDADGDDLEITYRHILEDLAKEPGTLGTIFRKAQNRIQDPAKLKRLIVDLIDKENWSATGADIKGDAYEALLAKGAEDIKSGAGQYFTPRALIQTMVDCIQPTVADTVVDPAAGFLQHIATILDINGRAAVVLPDNVLFEGGAGETLRRRMLRDFDVHTMLRLPTGIFYAQGVKANVLFFDKKPAAEHPWTTALWVYDLRINQHFTLKQHPLRRHHLDNFVDCYAPGKPHSERVESKRFRAFTYDELTARDKANLDITWLRDESLEDMDNLPAPEVIAREIVEDLTAALAEFEAVASALEANAGTPARRNG
jgi:type I restriction-modification system DNA methylase subunit